MGVSSSTTTQSNPEGGPPHLPAGVDGRRPRRRFSGPLLPWGTARARPGRATGDRGSGRQRSPAQRRLIREVGGEPAERPQRALQRRRQRRIPPDRSRQRVACSASSGTRKANPPTPDPRRDRQSRAGATAWRQLNLAIVVIARGYRSLGAGWRRGSAASATPAPGITVIASPAAVATAAQAKTAWKLRTNARLKVAPLRSKPAW